MSPGTAAFNLTPRATYTTAALAKLCATGGVVEVVPAILPMLYGVGVIYSVA